MAKQLEDFPTDVRENLTDGAQQVFLAAFNSASDNGLSEEGALQVAWNSVKQGFDQGSDGKWHRRADEPGNHNKSITTGGN